jgi:ATP-dependent helicase/nuclease subunit B
LRAPDDPQFDPESWLDQRQRGDLLHRVFQEFVTVYQNNQARIVEPQALDAMRAIARDAIAVWRERVPPPGEAAFAIESAEIMRAAEAFLAMERDAIAAGDGAAWLHAELSLSTANASAQYRLNDGRMLPIAGRVDRVDALSDGSLRVIDYKSGSATRYRASGESAFGGGRFLQPALYAESVASLLRQPVSRFEFRFPTERGQHSSIGYSEAALAESRVHISALIGSVRAGAFLPTTEPNDCMYCDFAAICRVRIEKYHVDSPRAEWAAANAPLIAEYAPMLARRGDIASDGVDE